jgi:hypothetical protein
VHLAGEVDAEGKTWSPQAAARHMDERQEWWMKWPKAQRDHGTACVSCHTVLPYAMARATLREQLGEKELTHTETTMLAYVTKRVNAWSDMEPFYNDEHSGPRKSVESKVTEGVLNAFVLARYDLPSGTMSPATRTAFGNMWSSQILAGADPGAWEWLNFHNAPWEGETSPYFGATLAALAVGLTPRSYQHQADIQPNIAALRGYLQRNYAAQPLINKALMLWASEHFPGVIDREGKASLIRQITALQQADGGWSLASLGEWKRRDNTPIDAGADGYATGLCVYVLREAGLSRSTTQVSKGLQWLVANQDSESGLWMATSLNKQRDPASDPYLFMSDAATGFAVLALEASR